MWYDPIHQLLASRPVLPAVYIIIYTCWVSSICYIYICTLFTFSLVEVTADELSSSS